MYFFWFSSNKNFNFVIRKKNAMDPGSWLFIKYLISVTQNEVKIQAKVYKIFCLSLVEKYININSLKIPKCYKKFGCFRFFVVYMRLATFVPKQENSHLEFYCFLSFYSVFITMFTSMQIYIFSLLFLNLFLLKSGYFIILKQKSKFFSHL